mgnify:CR=1 FL=1
MVAWMYEIFSSRVQLDISRVEQEKRNSASTRAPALFPTYHAYTFA